MECKIHCVLAEQQIVDFFILVIPLKCCRVWAGHWHLVPCLYNGDNTGSHLRVGSNEEQMRKFINFFEKSLAFDKQYKRAYFIYVSDHD